MIWMDVDTALSGVPINLVALTDDTDFKTREESATFNQSGLDLVWNFVTSDGAFTQTAVTPTDTAGDYDWVNQGNGDYTIEIPASGGASINNDTEGYGWFSGFATGILPWRGPTIGFRAAALNDALVDGGDNLDVNAVEWLGTAVTTSATTNLPETDAKSISDNAAAADNVQANIGNLDASVAAIPTTAMRGTDSAATATDLLDKLGAVNESAAAGDPSATESVMQYVKQIVNILAGSAGVVTYPAEAAPGNAISLAEVISAIHADVTGLSGSAMRGTDSASTHAASDVDTTLTASHGAGAWTTGAGGSDRLLMIDTTIATLASQTSFTLTAGSADDKAYENCTIVIEDASTSTQKAKGLISAYTGATKTVTLKYDPSVFTMAVTDKVYILAENSLKSTEQNRQLDVTSSGAAGIDWGNVENASTAVDLSATDIQLCDTITTYTSNTVQTGDSFARIGVNGAGLTAIVWNSDWDAEVQSECTDALVAAGLDHLVIASVVGADVADNSIIAYMVSKSATADWDSFVNADDSLQGISDGAAGGGATAAEVWAHSERTLTQSANATVAAVSGSTITILRGDTLSFSLTGLGSITGQTKLWFTVKSDTADADAKAIFQITEADGLIVLNKSVENLTAGNGTITIDDASAGDITVTLGKVETASLVPRDSMSYDVQWANASGQVATLTTGTCNVTADVTRDV